MKKIYFASLAFLILACSDNAIDENVITDDTANQNNYFVNFLINGELEDELGVPTPNGETITSNVTQNSTASSNSCSVNLINIRPSFKIKDFPLKIKTYTFKANIAPTDQLINDVAFYYTDSQTNIQYAYLGGDTSSEFTFVVTNRSEHIAYGRFSGKFNCTPINVTQPTPNKEFTITNGKFKLPIK